MNKIVACALLLASFKLIADAPESPSSESAEPVAIMQSESIKPLPLEIPPMTPAAKQSAPTSNSSEVVFSLDEDQKAEAKAALEKQSKRKYFSISLPFFTKEEKTAAPDTSLAVEESPKEEALISQEDSLLPEIKTLENRSEGMELKKAADSAPVEHIDVIPQETAVQTAPTPAEIPAEEVTTQIQEKQMAPTFEEVPDVTTEPEMQATSSPPPPPTEPADEIQQPENTDSSCTLKKGKLSRLFANISIATASAAVVVLAAVLGSH